MIQQIILFLSNNAIYPIARALIYAWNLPKSCINYNDVIGPALR